MILLKWIDKLLNRLTDDIIYLMDNECLRELIVFVTLFTGAMLLTAFTFSHIVG